MHGWPGTIFTINIQIYTTVGRNPRRNRDLQVNLDPYFTISCNRPHVKISAPIITEG